MMYSKEKKEELFNKFYTNAENALNENCATLNYAGYMAEGEDEVLVQSIKKVDANVYLSIPEGVVIDRVNLRVHNSGKGKIDTSKVTVYNKSTSKKFKYVLTITGGNVFSQLKEFFIGIYTDLIEDAIIESNLEAVNEALKKVTEKAGVEYTVSVTSPMGNKDKKVAVLTDDEVVFVADAERILDVPNLVIVQDAEENDAVEAEDVEAAIEAEAGVVATAQTTEQLVQIHGGTLISYLCDINKRTNGMTLIKKVTNKDIEKLRGNNDAVAYYSKDGVFAIVEKVEGSLNVILTPFDTNTFRKVDVDVISALA